MNQYQKFEKGNNIEKHIAKIFEGCTQTIQTEFYDILIPPKTYVEVKSAELRVSQGRKNGTRWGRFVINKICHNKLLEKNGWYALVITFQNIPAIIRFIQASKTITFTTDHTTIIPITDLYKGITIKEFKQTVARND